MRSQFFQNGFLRVLRVSVVIPILLTAAAYAQERWTLTTADFRSKQVDLVSIDDAGAKVSDDPAAPPRVVKWDDLLGLDRESADGAAAAPRVPTTAGAGGKFVVYLAGGDQLRGEPAKIDGETLVWNSAAVGAMNLPMRDVVGFTRAGQPAPRADEKRTEDAVLLQNGDAIRGIVAGLGDGTVKVQSQGNEVPVPLDSVTSLVLASTPGGGSAANRGASGRAVRVKLADDSVVTAPSVRTQGDRVLLAFPGQPPRQVPLASVAGIEQINGPVSWLSSRAPSENVQTPLLDTPRPARMDRTVTGRPLRVGERTFGRGIGVAPYSRLVFPLDSAGGYKAFRTQYAIDGNGSYADVTVRIKLDDKVVHERKDLTAGELSPVVTVPLAGAKTLTLEVDYGQNLNVQDKFDWIEPALVKSVPPPPAPAPPVAPPTQPAAAAAATQPVAQ